MDKCKIVDQNGQVHIEIITKGMEDQKGAKTDNIGNTILRHLPFACDNARNLYYYDSGKYHIDGEQVVRVMYKRLVALWNVEWKKSQESGVIEYVKVEVPRLWDRPPLNKINLLNGIYDIDREELLPHSSNWLSTTQIPMNYDKDAECQYWEKFLVDLFPVDGGADLLVQLMAWFLVPHTRLQKTVLLLGEGSNGKGTLLRMIEIMIGDDNISHASLHQLENERFSRGVLVGKLVNMAGDLPLVEIKNINVFKNIVGEDTIQIEYKGCQPFSYRPYCRLLFSSNRLPKVNDDTEGYKRRWLIIPFSQVFAVDPEKGKELEDKLSHHQELSGLLNLLLTKIPTILESGFTISPEVAELVSNYAPLPDNVRQYFDNYLEVDEESVIPSEELYIHFLAKCWGRPDGKEGYRGLTTFIKNKYPNVKFRYSARINGKVTSCIKGLRYRQVVSIDVGRGVSM